MFIHRLRIAIGGMFAVLGGVDSLVFTAGVGENSSEVRAAACNTLGFLGIRLDSELNLRPSLDADISAADSRVRILVIRAEEDWAIATECWKLARIGAKRQRKVSGQQVLSPAHLSLAKLSSKVADTA
jgi:acetate kinase